MRSLVIHQLKLKLFTVRYFSMYRQPYQMFHVHKPQGVPSYNSTCWLVTSLLDRHMFYITVLWRKGHFQIHAKNLQPLLKISYNEMSLTTIVCDTLSPFPVQKGIASCKTSIFFFSNFHSCLVYSTPLRLRREFVYKLFTVYNVFATT